MSEKTKIIGRVIIQKDWPNKQSMVTGTGILVLLFLVNVVVLGVALALQNLQFITTSAILLIIIGIAVMAWVFMVDYRDKSMQIKKSFEVPEETYWELRSQYRMLRLTAVSLMDHNEHNEIYKELQEVNE